MNFKLIFVLFALLTTLSPLAHAHDDGDDDADEAAVTAEDVILDREYRESANTQPLRVVIHKAGHLEAKPFVVEVTEACEHDARVIDTTSACDVAADTVNFSAERSELALLVRQPNEEGVCLPQPKRVVFQLRSACGEID